VLPEGDAEARVVSSSAARRTYSVLSWPAAEVAEALNTTPAAVNSALLRARTQIAKVAPLVDNIVETCRAAPARAARPLRRSLHQRCCMRGAPQAQSSGDRWIYLRSPIGLYLEVVHMPDGALPYEGTTSARRRSAAGVRWWDR